MDLQQRDAPGGAPEGGGALIDLEDHRACVVRRLLERGVSARTLCALLPPWEGLILRVSAEVP